MDGIINVYKEAGYTSHDVVARLRGILHIKKIGHTGTLDPDATGVLPVCIGKATKVCDIITDRDKTYEAEVVLGVATDTLDVSGTVVDVKNVSVTGDELKAVLLTFIGETEQIPPMYSAIKINGKKLYEYARQGKEIERKPRCIRIDSIELLDDVGTVSEIPDGQGMIGKTLSHDDIEAFPSFKIRVTCSKGTYIRTLCEDIGKKLGTTAAMKSLVRTAVGRFKITDAITLDEIEKTVTSDGTDDPEKLSDKLIAVDEVFITYRAVKIKPAAKKLLINGNPLLFKDIETILASSEVPDAKRPGDAETESGQKKRGYIAEGEIIRVYDDTDDFMALYRCENNRLKVYKFFA